MSSVCFVSVVDDLSAFCFLCSLQPFSWRWPAVSS